MSKSALLNELAANTYVMLRPSPVEGIGVFAIRDIPKGCRDMFSTPGADTEAWLPVLKEEVKALPAHARRLIENYCLYDEHHYFVPERGFKKLDLVMFLNHSDTPNIVSIDDGAYFEAIMPIAAGEELLVDYGGLVEDGQDD